MDKFTTFFQATSNEEVIGAIVCKLDVHKKVTVRGYIAMLAVDHRYRKRKIGKVFERIFFSLKGVFLYDLFHQYNVKYALISICDALPCICHQLAIF